ncbi:hypothetical protein GCM10010363_54210 [Streptomyces omiyaensis]|nr:hypothetical protein GCM10010363_54210 [Streptomyces omiyaensis]
MFMAGAGAVAVVVFVAVVVALVMAVLVFTFMQNNPRFVTLCNHEHGGRDPPDGRGAAPVPSNG